MKIDVQSLRQWIGKTATRAIRISEEPFVCMAATLGRRDLLEAEPSLLPPLWHWLYDKPVLEQSELRIDGMPRESDILPRIALPRRMWAAGELQFHDDLRIGDTLCKTSEISDIVHKQGRSGELVFVSLVHSLASQRGPALTEWHTIVFRSLETEKVGRSMEPGQADAALDPEAGRELRPEPEYSREIVPDEILLFRYSALTFNSHRIHYDRRYATQVEGYPGLVVHGPLIATLLLDLVGRSFPGRRVESFAFKAVSPIFDLHPFRVHLCFDGSTKNRFVVWASDHAGRTCVRADGVLQ